MTWIDEARLDDPLTLETIDRHGSLRALALAGAQVRRSLLASEEAGVDTWPGRDRPRSVLVAALGGSSVVADVLDLLARGHSPVPVTARPGGPLPGWVGPLDLVIAVSQSGRATGPLHLATEAARRGAHLLTIGAADSPLAEVSARARGTHIDVVTDAPSSRTALWSLLTPALRAADALGVVAASVGELEAAADRLDERAQDCRPASESFVNPAKDLALTLSGAIPVVLGDGPLTGVAAQRLAAMLTRTARVPAIHGQLPDDAARIVSCFDGPLAGRGGGGTDIFADPHLDGPAGPSLALVLLRDRPVDPPTPGGAAAESLASAVAQAARESAVRVVEVHAAGGSALERLASLIALGDYAATYAALGQGWDPVGSPHVADLRDLTG